MDMFVVPTISFRLLYGLLIMGHGPRNILWFGVTAHPNAEWTANQVTQACGWEQAPRYLIRDRDGAFGEVFIGRLRSIGIRDRPTSPRSPWQNGYTERLIGSIRRECLDHVVVFSELTSHTSIPGERCADLARRRTSRAHSLPPNSRRATPPICPDLIYDRHSHKPRIASLGRRSRTTCAACTNSVLRYLLPRLEILPRIVRSPVDSCFGTSPSQAPKSRPCLNPVPLPIAATTALEMIGPTPGTVIRR